MAESTTPALEWWQRGPIEGILPIFQPAAHALLQSRDELQQTLQNFPSALLWESIYSMASIGFHLQHIVGVLDRLYTYAKDKSLSDAQLSYLKTEGVQNEQITLEQLLEAVHAQVETCLQELSTMREDAPTAVRFIGRKRIPTTQLGLVFHAAEHMMRHTGQALVTARVLQEKAEHNIT
ncbi:MAG: DinB family protein [Flavihumibacter sp.]|jgi:uncharacterized damage-inducible protein DinB|nr:DinB family protein [Flavihumibacter sp.]